MIQFIKNFLLRRKIKVDMKVDIIDPNFKESKSMKEFREKFVKKQNDMMKIMFDVFSSSKMSNQEKAMVGLGMFSMMEQVTAKLNPVIQDYASKHLEVKEEEKVDKERPSYFG